MSLSARVPSVAIGGWRGAAADGVADDGDHGALVEFLCDAVERLAAVPTEPGFVLFEVTLLRLRALLARARGELADYRDFAQRYRQMATSLGFEGHMAMAETMI